MCAIARSESLVVDRRCHTRLCSCRGLDPVSRRPAMTRPPPDRIAQDGQSMPAVAQGHVGRRERLERDAATVAAIASVPVRPARDADAPVAADSRTTGRCPWDTRRPWRSPHDRSVRRCADRGARRNAADGGSGMNPSCGPVVPPCTSCGPSQVAAVRSQAARTDCPAAPGRRPVLPVPGRTTNTSATAGIRLPGVRVRPNWRVDGLELEDTVVHYDTVLGETYVEPSNRVCLYCPAIRRGPQGLRHHRARSPGTRRRRGKPAATAGLGRRADRHDDDSAGTAGPETGHRGPERLPRTDSADRPGKQSGPDRRRTADCCRTRISRSSAAASWTIRKRPAWRTVWKPPSCGATTRPCRS